jgi:hypothetical protein
MNIPDMTPAQEAWNRRLAELKAFGAKFGHRNVTPQTPGYPQLGAWVSGTRNKAKYGKLTAEQIADLEAVDFLWEINELRKPRNLAEPKMAPTRNAAKQRNLNF